MKTMYLIITDNTWKTVKNSRESTTGFNSIDVSNKYQPFLSPKMK